LIGSCKTPLKKKFKETVIHVLHDKHGTLQVMQNMKENVIQLLLVYYDSTVSLRPPENDYCQF
jgi:hypothetical protein